MNIKIFKDDSLSRKMLIKSNLMAYNKPFIDDRDSGFYQIFLFEGETMIAGMLTSYSWNYAYIDAYFYDKEYQMRILLNESNKYYEKKVYTTLFSTFNPLEIGLFKRMGFKIKGTLYEKPKGYVDTKLCDQKMTVNKLSHEYTVQYSCEKENDDSKFVSKQYQNMSAIRVESEIKNESVYVAYVGDEFVGGVYAYERQDYLSISLLWIKEAYRGYGIAKRLMGRVEEEAAVMGINRATVGTLSFQAKPFYEKLGYEVVYTLENRPIGHHNYAMIKMLNK